MVKMKTLASMFIGALLLTGGAAQAKDVKLRLGTVYASGHTVVEAEFHYHEFNFYLCNTTYVATVGS